MKKIIDGNTACALSSYALSEFSPIYPITPSTLMGELFDKWSEEGKQNILKTVPKSYQMQSEAGAASTMHGALLGGTLSTTFTCSQGLLLMIPAMYKIAGELLPNVIHVASRSIATHALSIFGDHSDVMAVRQTGYAMLCSSSVQEAHDMSAISHLATLRSSVPFIHFFDGFRTSHEFNLIEEIDYDKLTTIYPHEDLEKFRNRSLSPYNPKQLGTAQNSDIFFQNTESRNKFYNDTPSIVQTVMNDFYKITGRQYKLFDYYGSPSAKNIIILMGSGAKTCQSTINYLNELGEDYGIISVRLFRPFSIEDFISLIPKTVKNIAVLDRVKENGASGEPLYKDVVTALYGSNRANITVVGGRYGIGNKDFTPSMIKSVFDNLKSDNPKNNFSIGINDDVTHSSLDYVDDLRICEGKMKSYKFYGFGGDGTVSAGKSAAEILHKVTGNYTQAYFEYDSKKTGNTTIAHLRYSKNPILECYLTNNIDITCVNNQTYVTKYNILKNIKNNATLILNTNYTTEQLEKILPNKLKKEIAKKQIKFYKIDAYNLSLKYGLNGKINIIMQTAFFKLNPDVDFDKTLKEIKQNVVSSYLKFGEKVVERNILAIDEAISCIEQVIYPKHWATLTVDDGLIDEVNDLNKGQIDYYNKIIKPIQSLDGDKLPVSSLCPFGEMPTNTSKLEKRGIANSIPTWISENCIQCNLCTLACPHAAIRSYLVKDSNLLNKPELLQTKNAMAEKGKQFIIQVNPKDCTGCNVCVNTCPVLKKALQSKPYVDYCDLEETNYNFVESLPQEKSIFKPNTVKGLGFEKPYFEFSGACAGCGETPYLKMLSQLFGERTVIANATGCSSIYSGSAPVSPFVKNDDGFGISWANSLFEDNAEFGLGLKISHDIKNKQIKYLLEQLKQQKFITDKTTKNIDLFNSNGSLSNLEFTEFINELKEINNSMLVNNILQLKGGLIKQSNWIVGGDGWAYDIGFGGLDHILASGENINILVLDTEVYSNTGGQASKATSLGAVAKFASSGKKTRKKDLAMIAKTYKDVYIAKVSLGANPTQTLNAFIEAESYNGVSLIIAYSPCISHGFDMSKSYEHMKLAVESGYWNLFRRDPRKEKNFILDSKKPTKTIKEFLVLENRYRSLLEKYPSHAEKLFDMAQKDSDDYYNMLENLSKN